MLADAVGRGRRRLLMGLGGSATCDGGEGMLKALQHVDMAGVSVVGACDVSNPLLGPEGAACVFAPQKGATAEQVTRLEARLERFAQRMVADGRATEEMASMPGAGAAGGLGYAILAGLGGTLCPGIDVLMEACRWDERIADADLILTGEGCTDRQTLMGKVPMGVLRRSGGIPVVVLSGRVEDTDALRQAGFAQVMSINEVEGTQKEQVLLPEVAMENLQKTVLALSVPE